MQALMKKMAKPNAEYYMARRAGKQGLDIYEYLIKLLDRYERRYSQMYVTCKKTFYMIQVGRTYVCPVCGTYRIS